MRPGFPRTKLVAWAVLVLAVGGLNLAGREAGGPPDRNVLFSYAVAVGGMIQYAVILAVVLLIARGVDRRETFALHRPRSLPAAAGWIVATLVAVWAVSALLGRVLDAGKEQGLVPDHWESGHAGAFAANFVVVAVVAPIVEELTFRGLGFSSVAAALGPVAAVFVVGVAFGVWHGLVIAFPVLAILGAVLAALRLRTGSVFPPMVAHAIFNGTALVAAVTLGSGS